MAISNVMPASSANTLSIVRRIDAPRAVARLCDVLLTDGDMVPPLGRLSEVCPLLVGDVLRELPADRVVGARHEKRRTDEACPDHGRLSMLVYVGVTPA